MNPCDAYYSLIQYHYDLRRMEAVNVGVVVFCPQYLYLSSLFDRDLSWVRQAYQNFPNNIDLITSSCDTMSRRVSTEAFRIKTREDFSIFCSSRTGMLTLTKPKWSRTIDPEDFITERLQSLVLKPRIHNEVAERRKSERDAKAKLREAFSLAEQLGKVKRGLQFSVPNHDVKIRSDFFWVGEEVNVVVHNHFSRNRPESDEIKRVAYWGMKSHLLSTCTTSSSLRARLIYVPTFSNEDDHGHLRDFASQHILKNGGRVIEEDAIGSYKDEVETMARALPEDPKLVRGLIN